MRQSFLALFASLVVATGAQAGVMLQASLSAVQPTIPSVGGPLVAYDLRAVSDDGEVINTVASPSIVPNLGVGLHQVWTPIVSGPTPTRAEHAPPLWSDTWRPYDSYFLFDANNSLSAGGAFTETNDGVGGAPLPTAGFGAPTTGFGTYGSGPGASKLFTLASGFPDSDVTFAQLVMRATDSVDVSMAVLDNTGQRFDFTDFCVGLCVLPPVFEVDDLFLGGALPGALITGGPLPTNDSDDPDSVAWALVSLIGPDGAEVGASVDPLTGEFSWQSATTDSRGNYMATISGTNVGGDPLGSDTGILSFNLVPEPSALALLGIGMVGLVGFARRRGC